MRLSSAFGTARGVGGGDSELLLQVEHSSIASGSQQLHVGISGLKGGHSGEALHHSRHMFHALTDCEPFSHAIVNRAVPELWPS